MARAIADGNYFDEVVICDSALRADDKIAREETLSQEEVGELTDKLDVDFLIALENLQLKATKYIHYPCRLAMLLRYYRLAGTANGKNLRSEPDTPHTDYYSE